MEELNNNTNLEYRKENQEIKNSTWGGVRENAGRPKGESDNSILKRKLRDYISNDELDLFIESLKNKAMEDSKVMMYLLDHIFGKARQNLGLDGGEDGKNIIIQVAKEVLEKNAVDESTSNDSEGHS